MHCPIESVKIDGDCYWRNLSLNWHGTLMVSWLVNLFVPYTLNALVLKSPYIALHL